MKKALLSILFLTMLYLSVRQLNNIVIDKTLNRYYMLDKELENKEQNYDVEIFGSCHAYTSFNPISYKKNYGYSAYNMANPSEIIPISYLRMLNQFKENKPKVVLVEIWGINAYNTYIECSTIFENYSPLNLELIPISKEKIEVINDFDEFNMLNDNLAFARYKDRIVNLELHDYDFNYSFAKIKNNKHIKEEKWVYDEMENRFKNNGYLSNSSNKLNDYLEQQKYTHMTNAMNPEKIMIKYINRIIELCEQNDVKLIFYRAPYISNKEEIMKANWLADYLKKKNIEYYDLEKEIKFDVEKDFYDYQHLSQNGAEKATLFLGRKINKYLKPVSN